MAGMGECKPDIEIKVTMKFSIHMVCSCKFVRVDVCVENFYVNLIPIYLTGTPPTTTTDTIENFTRMAKITPLIKKTRV